MTDMKMDTERLTQLLEENRLLKEMYAVKDNPEVLVRATSYSPQIVIDLGNNKSVAIQHGSKNASLMVPYEAYLTMKRSTSWFDDGYLYSDFELTDENPNLIIDIKSWIKDRTETQLRPDLQKITSVGPVNALYEYTEEILFRNTDQRLKTGKIRTLRQETIERLSEISGYSIVEDSPE